MIGGVIGLRTEQRDVVGGLWDAVGDVEEEDAEGEEHDDSDLHFLRRRAEEDGEQEDGRHQTGQDDVHNVEGIASLHVQDKLHVGEALRRAAFEGELLADDLRRVDLPLAVFLERIHVDDLLHVGQVHLGRVVRPRTKHEAALLLVERVVRDVDLAHRLEHAPGLPVHFALVRHNGAELAIVTVDAIRTARDRFICHVAW
jgi:hypothetical protein